MAWSTSEEAFIEAARCGRVAEVRRLLVSGVGVNARSTGEALRGAAEGVTKGSRYQFLEDGLKVVELLLKEGADVHAKDRRGETALFKATSVDGGRLAMVKLLVENGADVKATNNRGWTALHIAARLNRKEIAYFLLEHGAFALIANNERLTPLDYAIKPRRRPPDGDPIWNRVNPKYGEPDVDLICKMLLPSGALVRLAKDVVEAHEKRQKRIEVSLKRAEQRPGFLTALAGALAGIEAPDCARGTGTVLAALVRKMDAFAKSAGNGTGAQEANQAPKRVRRE